MTPSLDLLTSRETAPCWRGACILRDAFIPCQALQRFPPTNPEAVPVGSIVLGNFLVQHHYLSSSTQGALSIVSFFQSGNFSQISIISDLTFEAFLCLLVSGKWATGRFSPVQWSICVIVIPVDSHKSIRQFEHTHFGLVRKFSLPTWRLKCFWAI